MDRISFLSLHQILGDWVTSCTLSQGKNFEEVRILLEQCFFVGVARLVCGSPSTCGAVALQLFVSFSCVVWWFCLSFAFWPSLSLCCSVRPQVWVSAPPSSLRSVLFSFVTLGCCAWSFWPQTGPGFPASPSLAPLTPPALPSLSCWFLSTSAPVWYL